MPPLSFVPSPSVPDLDIRQAEIGSVGAEVAQDGLVNVLFAIVGTGSAEIRYASAGLLPDNSKEVLQTGDSGLCTESPRLCVPCPGGGTWDKRKHIPWGNDGKKARAAANANSSAIAAE